MKGMYDQVSASDSSKNSRPPDKEMDFRPNTLNEALDS